MTINMYLDNFLNYDMTTEDEVNFDNCATVHCVPEKLVHDWFDDTITNYKADGFEQWFKEESLLEDFDGFLEYTKHVPKKIGVAEFCW